MLKIFINKLKTIYKLYKFRSAWRKNNKQNFSRAFNIFPLDKVTVGKYTYGNLNVHTYGVNEVKLDIGSFCSIAGDVHFFLGSEHPSERLSTYPFKVMIRKDKVEARTKGPIIVKDDVWIGYGAKILSGVTLGQGCIIGAGSVVSQDIPPYAVYAGGKIVKYRFDDMIISKLVNVNLSKLDEKMILENMDDLYTDITEEFLESDFISKLVEKDFE